MNWYKLASFNEDLLDSLVRDLGKEKGKLLTEDVEKEIKNIGIPYRFENIAAYGMAKNDICIISDRLLWFSPSNLIFSLFHELAHYYQYRKYGQDIAISIYTNPESEIQKDIKLLKEIELTADKFARLKASYYIKKYKINYPITMTGYRYTLDSVLRDHLLKIKKQVKDMNYTTVQEINEHIYNQIKAK